MNLQDVKLQLLSDENFRREYEKVDLGFEVGKMITSARIIARLTQNDLARRVGTKQPSIARVESGNYLPSLSFLQKVARALGTELLPPKFANASETTNYSIDYDYRRPRRSFQLVVARSVTTNPMGNPSGSFNAYKNCIEEERLNVPIAA